MKYYSIFAEIFFTFIVASALSFLVSVLAYMTLQLFSLSNDELLQQTSLIGTAAFGVVVGYRLNDVIRSRKKTAK